MKRLFAIMAVLSALAGTGLFIMVGSTKEHLFLGTMMTLVSPMSLFIVGGIAFLGGAVFLFISRLFK